MSDEALGAARNAFAKAMQREPFPMECEVTGDWPIEPAIKAYLATLPQNTDLEDTVNLLRMWCSLFFGRNGDGTHMSNDTYATAHHRAFERTSAWLTERGYR